MSEGAVTTGMRLAYGNCTCQPAHPLAHNRRCILAENIDKALTAARAEERKKWADVVGKVFHYLDHRIECFALRATGTMALCDCGVDDITEKLRKLMEEAKP